MNKPKHIWTFQDRHYLISEADEADRYSLTSGEEWESLMGQIEDFNVLFRSPHEALELLQRIFAYFGETA